MTIYDPEPGPRSYGTPEGVAALARAWTDDGDWIDPSGIYVEGTNPTLTNIVKWIDQVSAILNTALAKYGFVTPIAQSDAKQDADSIVEQLVADMANYANSTGRFFSQRFIDSGYSVWRTIRNDIDDWVLKYAAGLEALGVPRQASSTDEIGFRGTDEVGDETFPVFQRKGFGNQFENWTK